MVVTGFVVVWADALGLGLGLGVCADFGFGGFGLVCLFGWLVVGGDYGVGELFVVVVDYGCMVLGGLWWFVWVGGLGCS